MVSAIPNIIRLVILLFLQIGIFQFIDVPNLNIFIYPLFIILLPFRTPNWLVIIMAFVCGLFVDGFYNSIGLHAAAATLMAFARTGILNILEPRSGYENITGPFPRLLSPVWFMQYLIFCTLAFSLTYFLLEAFAFSFVLSALLKTAISVVASSLIMFLITLMLNPKN